MPEKPDIAQLIGSISADARSIVRGEVSLAARELKPIGPRLAIDGVFAGAAVFLLVVATVAIPVVLAAGLSWAFHGIFPGLSPWACVFWGSLVSVVVFVGTAVICGLVFYRRAKASGRLVKERVGGVAASARQAASILQEGVRQGIAQGQELVGAGGRRD